jgi:hypothetical protein
MATRPADQQRPVLIAAAIFAVALALVAARSINASAAIEVRPLPPADMQAIASFLRPLADTPRLAGNVTSGMLVTRDPFVMFVVAPVASIRSPAGTTVNSSSPKSASTQPWVVSTILVEGSRKSAIVNNMWVTVGDSLGGGSHLTEVEADHIVVTDAKGIRHKVSIQGGESWYEAESVAGL